jgi:hypothetical protein
MTYKKWLEELKVIDGKVVEDDLYDNLVKWGWLPS